MRRGHFKATEKLIDILASLGISLNDQLKLIGNHIKRDIDNIVSTASTKKAVQTLMPVFQWGQNRHNVIMQVKFAHRWDSPGCLDTKNTNVEFTPFGVSLTADCIQSNQPLHFDFNISLLEEIDVAKSSWSLEAVGRLFMNMTKVTGVIWERLLNGTDKLPQMKIWWDAKDLDQYSKDMETFAVMMEEAEDKGDCMNNKKCREKKEKNKGKVTANNVIVDGRRVDGDGLSKFMKMG